MISVAIVDDQRDIREGLQKLLDMTDEFRCLATFEDGPTALSFLPGLRPEVVLMDIDLPGMSGIECARALRQNLPDVHIIMLTAYSDDEHIFQALKAGAFGYLTKGVFPSKILGAIREVRTGGSPMSSHVARRVVSYFSEAYNPMMSLSAREREVLDLLCDGQSYRDIAKVMFVSPNTVRFHLKNIYKKLQVNSRYEAVAKATRMNVA
ncbi:MAG: response regulator [Saprospiraceae bacterium]